MKISKYLLLGILSGLSIFFWATFARGTSADLLLLLILCFLAFKYPIGLVAIFVADSVVTGLGRWAMPLGVPVRYFIFFLLCVVIGKDLWKLFRQKKIHEYIYQLVHAPPRLGIICAVLAIVIFIGSIAGIINGYSFHDIFLSVNGWGMWILLLGIPLYTSLQWKRYMRPLVHFYIGLSTVFSIVTIITFIIFSYGYTSLTEVWYSVIRHGGFGEITHVTDAYYRVFLYSIIWQIPLLLLSIFNVLKGNALFTNFLTGSIALITIMLSLSRSVWVGTSIAFIWMLLGAFLYIRQTFTVKNFFIRVGIILSCCVFATSVLHFLAFTVNPMYQGQTTPSRLVSDDMAGQSRMSLLDPLLARVRESWFTPSGFGTGVAFISYDPRVRAHNPSGWKWARAFEWGHLGLWLQLGLGGYIAFILAWVQVCLIPLKKIWHTENFPLWSVAALALLIVHIATPYIDHPLGITLAIFAAVWHYSFKEEIYEKESYNKNY